MRNLKGFNSKKGSEKQLNSSKSIQKREKNAFLN